MKKLIAALLILAPVTASAAFDNKANRLVVRGMIEAYGYRCDSVTAMSVSSWSGVVSVFCNDFRYSYELEDVGGNWVVRVN